MPTSLTGGGILFPGTISVLLFGFIGGTWVDKRGKVFVLFTGLSLIATGLLGVSVLVDKVPWLISCSMVLTFKSIDVRHFILDYHGQ